MSQMRLAEPEPKRRLEDKNTILNKFSKSILIYIITILGTGLLMLGGVVLAGEAKWRTQLETAISQSNVDAQSHITERLAATEAEIRALKETNVLRVKADERRDKQIDNILEGMGKLTNRLDVWIAIHERQVRGGN